MKTRSCSSRSGLRQRRSIHGGLHDSSDDCSCSDIITACGCPAAWDSYVRDLFAKVARLPSGFFFNTMCIAATASGEPAVQCVVCNMHTRGHECMNTRVV